MVKYLLLFFATVALTCSNSSKVPSAPQDAVNQAPAFQTSPADMADMAIVGIQYTDTISAHDADEDSLGFVFLGSLPGLQLSDGILAWTPTLSDTGIGIVSIVVHDGKDGYDTLSWSIHVSDSNHTPYFSTTAAEMQDTATVGIEYKDTVYATDADGDVIGYYFLNYISGVRVLYNVISWVPTINDTGSHSITLLTKDQRNASDTLQWQLFVRSNSHPYFTSSTNHMLATGKAGRLYSDTLQATDSEGDSLIYSFVDSIDGMVVEDGILTCIPQQKDTGSQTISVVVGDKFGVGDTLEWTIAISPNSPPVFLSLPQEMNDSGKTRVQYIDTLKIADPESNNVFYSFVDSVGGMSISNHVITWTPSRGDTGTHRITVRATDNYGGYDTLSWNICVTKSLFDLVIGNWYIYKQKVGNGPVDSFTVLSSRQLRVIGADYTAGDYIPGGYIGIKYKWVGEIFWTSDDQVINYNYSYDISVVNGVLFMAEKDQSGGHVTEDWYKPWTGAVPPNW